MTLLWAEQEMVIEALEAKHILNSTQLNFYPNNLRGLDTSNRCFQITISPHDDDADDPIDTPVQLALIFSHTEKYPDEPPLLNVKRRGFLVSEFSFASENLGMAIVYTLVTSAKEWLSEKYERFEAELALERAKLMPKSALTAPKEKKRAGRQWFESGRVKGAAQVKEGSEEEEEDIDFDDDDFEEDMLGRYLAEKSDSSSHSSRIAN
ncbi:hypothetical protein P3X46_011106 [Hevea brasiliensis]|uniref:RWD domain-containing protein n=1 Tax=Hevea brasiliensis TaxID=3981 RepID=A0ABQ9MHA2_HEVBR|nr:hypothetical protein P3X46_011106 [Hevea brasiliensis]